jgi:DNA-binding NarL/FixJ family response regulator
LRACEAWRIQWPSSKVDKRTLMALMGEGARPVRILVADDHPPMRSAFAAILSYGRGLEVVGEARDGREAVLKCEELRPDLVLMDLSMPQMDGIEATRAIKERLPTTVVLVVTAHEDEDLTLRAIRAGAAGYVLQGRDPSRLIAAVREAMSGESPMDQRVAGRLLRRLAAEESPADRLAVATEGRGSKHTPKAA